MRIQSKAVATLLFAYGVPAASAFTAFTAPTKPGTGARSIATHASTHHKSTSTALYTVTDSKSDTDIITDNEMEEKAWKIIKEKSEEGNVEASSNNDSAEKDVIEPELVQVIKLEEPTILDELDLATAVEEAAAMLVDEMALEMSEECELDEAGNAADELCMDESKLSRVKSNLKGIIGKTLGLVRTGGGDDLADSASTTDEFQMIDFDDEKVPEGELLERGWEERGNSSALRRNAEVWKFALSCVFKALKPKKLRKKGASDQEIEEAKTAAATYIRNGLLRLGPSFVKLVSPFLGTQNRFLPFSVKVSFQLQ
jgi:hypothetical protein